MSFGILSDLHYHSWSAFAETTPSGVNTRLQLLLDATRYAANQVRAAGSNKLFLAGDIFHKRGEVAPSVLNPVMDLYRDLIQEGFEIWAIPGNHDLEKNESARLGNSITALESVGVTVAHKPLVVSLDDMTKIVMFPWFSNVKDLTGVMTDTRNDLLDAAEDAGEDEPHLIAIIHAPIDGVLPHLPAHGLDAEELSSTGFNQVFSGHYHNHADMGDDVYSIGALAHQNWGDIGSKAGFLIVDDAGEVWQHETQHPKFVELTGDETEEQAEIKCDGNYVRVRAEIEKDAELQEIRDGVMALGALGCMVLPQRKTVVTRAGVTASSTSVSIESSIKAYLDKKTASADVHALALDILSEARAA